MGKQLTLKACCSEVGLCLQTPICMAVPLQKHVLKAMFPNLIPILLYELLTLSDGIVK